jgi:hypothetical protein
VRSEKAVEVLDELVEIAWKRVLALRDSCFSAGRLPTGAETRVRGRGGNPPTLTVPLIVKIHIANGQSPAINIATSRLWVIRKRRDLVESKASL